MVVVSNISGIFTTKIGEMIQFDEHMFKMGLFNHQLDIVLLQPHKDVLCTNSRCYNKGSSVILMI